MRNLIGIRGGGGGGGGGGGQNVCVYLPLVKIRNDEVLTYTYVNVKRMSQPQHRFCT